MYTLLTILTGAALAVMISINGNLSARYGAFPAAAIIHAVGSATAILFCLTQKKKGKITGHRPFWIYLGGVIGVATTVFQNLAFGKISMTSIVALGLLGQTVMSLFIDSFGLLGMAKDEFRKENIPGLLISLAGIGMMFDKSMSVQSSAAILISFCSGITVVLSRTANARLAEHTGALRSSMTAHLTGLPVTIIIALLVTKGTIPQESVSYPFRPWIYLGGVLGVMVILLCNITVPKVSAYKQTILNFLGQIFTGVILDLLTGVEYQTASFYGGIVIAAGIAFNYLMALWTPAGTKKEKVYRDEIKS